MWELLAEDGHRGADALEDRHGEGGTNSQAIDEIMEAVAQGDHPGQCADVRVADTFQPVAGALGSLQVLQESPPVKGWTTDLQGRPESSRPLPLKGPCLPSSGWPTDLDREGAHDDLLVHHRALPVQLATAALRNHVVQIPVLQLLRHPLLLVLLGRERLRGIMTVSVMMLEGPQGGVGSVQRSPKPPTQQELQTPGRPHSHHPRKHKQAIGQKPRARCWRKLNRRACGAAMGRTSED